MIRYIDKGTARQHLIDRLMESALNNVGIRADVEAVFLDIAKNRLPVWIDELPTYDVVEVRHGRWILDENPHDGDCRCSVCRVAIDAMNERNHEMLNILTGGKWWTFYHYCPNCGSRMDLDGDTE